MSPSSITPLASSQIDRDQLKVEHDQLKVEFVEPDTMPAMVRIIWPDAPTAIDPERFRDVAAALVQLFSEAHVTLTNCRPVLLAVAVH